MLTPCTSRVNGLSPWSLVSPVCLISVPYDCPCHFASYQCGCSLKIRLTSYPTARIEHQDSLCVRPSPTQPQPLPKGGFSQHPPNGNKWIGNRVSCRWGYSWCPPPNPVQMGWIFVSPTYRTPVIGIPYRRLHRPDDALCHHLSHISFPSVQRWAKSFVFLF